MKQELESRRRRMRVLGIIAFACVVPLPVAMILGFIAQSRSGHASDRFRMVRGVGGISYTDMAIVGVVSVAALTIAGIWTQLQRWRARRR